MPELERELKSDFRKIRRQVEETHAAVEPATARWTGELAAVNRKLASTRAHVSQLDFTLRERERDELKQKLNERRRQEQEERQAQLEQQALVEVKNRPRLGMTTEVAEFLAGGRTEPAAGESP